MSSKTKTSFSNFKVYVFFIMQWMLTRDSIAFARKSNPVTCNSCCAPWFNSPDGVVKAHDISYSTVAHTISYIVRCFLPNQETLIITDRILTNPISLDSDVTTEDGYRTCAYVENMPLSFISLTKFLESGNGFLRRTIDSPKQKYRVNLIFAPNSSPEIFSIISKLMEELVLSRARSRMKALRWEPNVIFVWPEVQQILLTSNKVIGKDLMDLWFGNFKPPFLVDSSIYFAFIVQKGSSLRSQQNLYISLWEVYSVKREFIMGSVRRPSFSERYDRDQDRKEVCNRKQSRLSPTIETVNSYLFLERFGRRGELRQVPVVAFVKENSDWIGISHSDDGTIQLTNGASVSLYNDMKLMLNFSELVQLGDEVQLFLPNETREYYRQFHSMNFNPYDISINQESMTTPRARNASFLHATYSGTYLAFFQQPSASTIRNIVSAPFTRSLWITFISTWFFVIILVYAWWGCIKTQRSMHSPNDLNFVNDIGLWTVAAVCQKSWYLSPKASEFKAILFNGSLMALVCYSAYSAMIVSFLTVKISPVRSLYDLVGYRYKFSVHERSEATLDLANQLIDTFNLPEKVIKVTTEEEISHIFKLNSAFLAYPDLFYSTAAKQNFTEEFICSNVSSVKAQNMPYKTAMSVPKGSQFREIFSQKLLKIMERGLSHRYAMAYEQSKPITCIKNMYDDDGKLELDPVKFTDVIITFLVVFIGCISACFILVIEKLYLKKRKLFYLL